MKGWWTYGLDFNKLSLMKMLNFIFDEGLVGNVISDEENGQGGLIYCYVRSGLDP